MIDFIRWRPPQVHWVKLNTDGACKGGNIAGCGGIIRGSDGEWIGGFAKFIGDCSAFVVELWGVLEGLRYVRRMGYTLVELNVDCVSVEKTIKEGVTDSRLGRAGLIKFVAYWRWIGTLLFLIHIERLIGVQML